MSDPTGAEGLAQVLQPLLPGPADDDERWDLDYETIRANLAVFDDAAIDGLLSGAAECMDAAGIQDLRARGLGAGAPAAGLQFARRFYELAQRVADVKGDREREGLAAAMGAGVCEQLGLIVAAMDCWEIARRAAEQQDDLPHYLIGTFNQARTCMMHPGLDYKAIALLEEALPLAEEQDHEEVLTKSCNFLIHLYEKKGKTQDVERIRGVLRRHI